MSRFDTIDNAEIARANRFSVSVNSEPGKELCRQIKQQHDSLPEIGGILSVEYKQRKWYVVSYDSKEIILEPPIAEQRVADRREAVNHPLHYGGDVPHEVVKCLHAWGMEADALLWNAIKYIARSSYKGNKLEDLKKAAWYLNRRIESMDAAAKTRDAHFVKGVDD